MMTYASPAWWHGRKMQAMPLASIQNKALRYISGAFHTTPIYALEIECSIPPIHEYLDYTNDRAALCFNRLSSHHPIVVRLPENLQPHITIKPPPLNPPHKNTRNWQDAMRCTADKAKHAQCTTLWQLASHMVPNSEIIDGTAELPWHKTLHDEKLCGHLTVKVPRNKAGESFKKEWA